MFAEWVTAGVAFGIKAFFAVVVFLTVCGAIVGLIGLLAGLFGGEEDRENREKRRPY
jgi:uncharacterized membrane protein